MGRPAGHRVLVKQDKLEETDSVYASARKLGIHLDTSTREQAAVDSGIVLALGPSAFRDFGGEAWCAIGDRVAFAKYSGKTVTDNKEELLVLNDEDVVYVYGEK